MRRTLAISAALLLSASMVLIARIGIAEGDSPPTPSVLYADQGLQWTCEARKQFYAQDQGAQTIPYAWLKALAQPDGKPFLADSLTRYGYLRADIPTAPGLPIGFTLADSSSGPMAGMTCAACHTRQIAVSGQPIRIDGGPAFADFGRYLIDLDTATLAVLAKPDAFDAFATEVLGSGASEAAKAVLRADLTVWSTRYHLIVGQSLPTDQLWGAARLDAVSMILNRVTGLDVGGAPTYAIPENIVAAGAPTRYPFLWNASRQDHTQWPGFAPNGNDFFALSRNLGEVYGVFGLFHPELGTGSVATLFNRNYLVHNSGNFAGLQTLETLIKRIGPPAWQWPVDQTLAARGKTIYASVKTGPANKSCNDCHGITINYSIEHFGNWVTPVQNVGTDRAEWRVLARQVATGSLEGATIPFVSPVLLQRDLAINVLKISVAGALGEQGVSSVTRDMRATAPLRSRPSRHRAFGRSHDRGGPDRSRGDRRADAGPERGREPDRLGDDVAAQLALPHPRHARRGLGGRRHARTFFLRGAGDGGRLGGGALPAQRIGADPGRSLEAGGAAADVLRGRAGLRSRDARARDLAARLQHHAAHDRVR